MMFNVISIMMYVADKYVPQACIMMSVYPFLCISYMIRVPGIWNFKYISVYSTLIAGLFMLYADKLKDKERKISLGLPTLGLEKPMGIATLISRVIIMFTIITIALNNKVYVGSILMYILAIPYIVVMVCVLIGYKTRMCALIMSVIMFLGSLEFGIAALRALFDSREEDTWRATVYFGNFCSFLAGVGALLQLACLGGGAYSLDHRKSQ